MALEFSFSSFAYDEQGVGCVLSPQVDQTIGARRESYTVHGSTWYWSMEWGFDGNSRQTRIV
jgi:hypothetical protein